MRRADGYTESMFTVSRLDDFLPAITRCDRFGCG